MGDGRMSEGEFLDACVIAAIRGLADARFKDGGHIGPASVVNRAFSIAEQAVEKRREVINRVPK